MNLNEAGLSAYPNSVIKAYLESQGYTVMLTSSYRRAQLRQEQARAERDREKDRREGAERWARDSLEQERRVRDRLSEVMVLATQHGMTTEDLRDFNRAMICGDWPAPCNCNDPVRHDGH